MRFMKLPPPPKELPPASELLPKPPDPGPEKEKAEEASTWNTEASSIK